LVAVVVVRVQVVEVAGAPRANAAVHALVHASAVEVACAPRANAAVHALVHASAVVVDALAHANVVEVAHDLPAQVKDGAQMVAMVVQK